ncbi:uncharacterized protein LOC143278877 [Babylonia areolata]|uniref:uncharacterized protein LOC143278877 n=1 Tax=Babylonia areolata TaxID=304850 RepID=UPI003FD1F678
MRRGLCRWRWGGKWRRPRCVSGPWRGSSWLGVVVSVWLCLITVVHLSLQPSPLLSLPPCQGPDSVRTSLFTDLRYTMGMVTTRKAVAVSKDGALQPLPDDVWTDRDTVGRAPLARSLALVGPDQRMLLTKEDSVNDANNSPAFFGDDTAQQGQHQHGYQVTHANADSFYVKEKQDVSLESMYSSPVLSFKDKERETQLERIPVSGTGYEDAVDGQQHTARPHPVVAPSLRDTTRVSHVMPSSRHTTDTQHVGNPPSHDPSDSAPSTINGGVNRFHVNDQASSSSFVRRREVVIKTLIHDDNHFVEKQSVLTPLEHLSQSWNTAAHRPSHSSFTQAASSSSPHRTTDSEGAVFSASLQNPDTHVLSPASRVTAVSHKASSPPPLTRDSHSAASSASHRTADDQDAASSASHRTADNQDAASSASHRTADNQDAASSASHRTADNQDAASSASHRTADNQDAASSASHRTADGQVAASAQHVSKEQPDTPHKARATQSPYRGGGSGSGGVWRRGGVRGERRGDVVEVGSRLKRDGFLEHAYNVTASDLLPMDRAVPDTRPDGCPLEWPDVTSAGPVSIIICTHNEAPSVLRRTVYSVLRQTPSYLLSDVIVVDDNTTIGDPARDLEVIGENVTQGRLRVLRTDGRQGLVRARLLGAEAARGRVLVFLDSHCECGPHWLPPLLTALTHDKHKVVSPYIDVIRSESFAYARSPDNLQGDFNWRLEFGWRAIPTHQLSAREGPHVPIRTPVISGGLFAVYRQFFFDIGSYDEHMDIWGGENMELSFRVWMCGGRLEIIPCSRVGHVFRSSVPYSFPGDRRHTVLRNLARAAHVWMDEYSPIFFAAVNMTSSIGVGDVTSRIALRQRLGCRSFQWYLENVAPHIHVPSPCTLQYGQFKNRGSLLCLTSSHTDGLPLLRLLACHASFNQTVELRQTGVLQMGGACVSLSPNKQLALAPCRHPAALWRVRGEHIYLDSTDLCMTSVDNEFVHLQTCHHGNPFQDWEPSYVFSWPS